MWYLCLCLFVCFYYLFIVDLLYCCLWFIDFGGLFFGLGCLAVFRGLILRWFYLLIVFVFYCELYLGFAMFGCAY